MTAGRRPRRGRGRGKTMRGGMGYGFGGTIGTAGPQWNSSWGGETTKSGEPVFEPGARPPVIGGRRKSRRKSKKSKKSKKSRRSMRGGASIASVGYGYTGTGVRGVADPTGYASKVAPAGGRPLNPDGVSPV